MTLLAVCVFSPALADGRRDSADDITYVAQGASPFCAAAATLMAASRFVSIPPLKAFVRELTVHRDGIAWLDINDALLPLGIEARVVTTNATELKTWLEMAIPVVVAIKKTGGGRHAIVVHGARDGGFLIKDPATPATSFMAFSELSRKWSAGQAVLVWPRGAPPRIDLEKIRREDRTYRGREWGLRAAKVIDRPKAALLLYERAIAEDDGVPELHLNRGLVLLSLAQHSQACDAFSQAAKLSPNWDRPQLEQRKARCKK